MSGIGVIWGIVRVAATRIPWLKVVENAPAVVDLVARAKDRLYASSQDDLVERLNLIHEENLKLEKVLIKTADHLQELENTLKTVVARQKSLVVATVASLLIAASSLLLWFVR